MPDCCRWWRACRYLSGMHDCHLLITWHCSTTCHLGSHCSWALALLAAFTHDECWMHARWLGHLGKLRSLNASSLSKELCHRYIANLGGTQASTSWMVNLSCLQFVQKVSRCARFTFFCTCNLSSWFALVTCHWGDLLSAPSLLPEVVGVLITLGMMCELCEVMFVHIFKCLEGQTCRKWSFVFILLDVMCAPILYMYGDQVVFDRCSCLK